jgi:hypothetical protein
MDGALRGLDSKEVEVPSMLRNIPDVGSERLLWFSSMQRGVEPLTLFF